MLKRTVIAAAAAPLVLMAGCISPAQAQTITLTGTVVNLCVLTISTPGVLGVNSNGVELSSSLTGGVAAVLAVVATGSNPTINFTAPALTGPSSVGSTTQMSFTSAGGANHPLDTTGYVYAMNRLLDTITINGRATNPSGFRSGVYTISSTATCSQ